MALDPKLLEILACPEDKGPLLYFPDESALYNPQGGFVFERFKAAGAVDPLTKQQDPTGHPLSMAIYGEHSTIDVGPEYHAGWTRPADQGGNVDWKAGDVMIMVTQAGRAFLRTHGRAGGMDSTFAAHPAVSRRRAIPRAVPRDRERGR